MKKLAVVFGLGLLIVPLLPSGARAQFGARNDRRADRICIYENSNYQGWEECYVPGEEVSNLHSRRNRTSSIRVFGNAAVTIFDNADYGGISAQVSSDIRDLAQFKAGGFGGQATWNDRVESIRVGSSNFRGPAAPPARGGRNDSRPDNRPGNNRGNNRNDDGVVCIYADRDYRGDYDCFAPGDRISDLGRAGDWSDRVSSIRVFGVGQVVLFVDAGFRGERLVIDRDIDDLRKTRLPNNRNWDNQVSSLQVGERGRRIF